MEEAECRKGIAMKNISENNIFRDFLNTWNFNEKYLIYGTSNTANSLLKKIGKELEIIGFLDSNPAKWGKNFAGYSIYSKDEWKKQYFNYKIIVASGAYTEIRDFLLNEGLEEQVDFCDSRFLIGCYFAARYNKVYFYRTDISITEYCNLRCEKCNMVSPYFKNPKHRELECLKEDVDCYFRWVDSVQLFNILGGEPFIHPQVEKFTEYVCKRYGNKIEQIVFFTNGIAKLQESMLELMKKYNIEVQVSDYRNGLPQIGKKVDEFIQKLEQYGISYRRNIDNEWLDFGFPDYCNEKMSDEELISFFDKCYSPFRGLSNKKLYYCHLNTAAVCAGLFEENVNDYFDLAEFEDDRKSELIKFDLGYTNLGYITYCKKCKGCFAVNSDYTDVARQLNKK